MHTTTVDPRWPPSRRRRLGRITREALVALLSIAIGSAVIGWIALAAAFSGDDSTTVRVVLQACAIVFVVSVLLLMVGLAFGWGLWIRRGVQEMHARDSDERRRGIATIVVAGLAALAVLIFVARLLLN